MKRELIILTLFFIVGVLTVQFILPKYQDYLFLKEKMKNLDETKERVKTYISTIQDVSQKEAEYQDEINKIKDSFLGKNLIPNFLNFLQKEISNSGLLLENIEFSQAIPTKEENVSNIGELVFTINCSGSYSSLKDFISKIENSAKIISFKNISLSKKLESNDLDISIEGKTYYEK